jgi:hypothetical protein
MLPRAEPLASGSSCLQALLARYSGMCCIVSAFCVTSLPHCATSRPALRPNSRHGGRFSCCTICHASPAYRRLKSDSLTERQPWSLTVGVLPWCHLCCDMPICLRKSHRWLSLLSVSFCNRMEACLTARFGDVLQMLPCYRNAPGSSRISFLATQATIVEI